MSTWFDLQRSIISDCKYSVLISFAVVFIFAAVMLRSRLFLPSIFRSEFDQL